MKKIIIALSGVLILIVIALSIEYNVNLDGKTFKINGTTYALSIDGERVNSIPSTGNYYLTSYSCKNGSVLSWNRETNTLSIEGNSMTTDNCYLEFNTNPLLNTMKVGDYVAYVGNNGCNNGVAGTTGTGNAEAGNSCLGENANQSKDTSGYTYGYCYSSNYRYYVYGWRIAYIENNKVYLTSAGSPECISRPYEETEVGPVAQSSISMSSSSSYYYGTSYTYDNSTGKFTLSGSTTSGVWSSIYNDVISTYKYTCKSTSKTGTCTTLYDITGYNSSTSASGNSYYNTALGNATHISIMNERALDYCNATYADGGTCSSSNTWAMGNADFQKITNAISGTSSNLTSAYGSPDCYSIFSTQRCGYNNNLIDNGGYYWFAAYYTTSSRSCLIWISDARGVRTTSDVRAYGFRPIIGLSSSVYVTGGSGTMSDPYTIGI